MLMYFVKCLDTSAKMATVLNKWKHPPPPPPVNAHKLAVPREVTSQGVSRTVVGDFNPLSDDKF